MRLLDHYSSQCNFAEEQKLWKGFAGIFLRNSTGIF